LTPRTKLLLSLPVIAAFVILLVYFQLFSSPVIIAIIFVAWVAVSLRNRRKFADQRARKDGKSGQGRFLGSYLLTQPFQSPSLAPWVLSTCSFSSFSVWQTKPQ
jgi:hypothetical protein